MKKFLTYKIPSIYSISILGAVVVILTGYTAFKAGEIRGRYEEKKKKKANKAQFKKRLYGARKINNDKYKSNPIFNTIADHYKITDVQGLISVKTSKDLENKRKELIHFLWGNSGLPISKLPRKININFYDKRYKLLYEDSLEKIDHVLVEMEYNLQSNIYHFIPKLNNGRLVIFHQGHGGDFVKNIVLIDSLLKSGYSVAGFCMPLLGLNNKPKIRDPRFGLLKLTSHNHIKFLKPEKGHHIKYFLEPIVVFLNYASHKYKDIHDRYFWRCVDGYAGYCC
ncbi:MAG: hypothetical protein JRJ76_08250 [Deltaproteobacteria bacterium]|nr:hypothetical protein [Deltaproteobacteria bacterium]